MRALHDNGMKLTGSANPKLPRALQLIPVLCGRAASSLSQQSLVQASIRLPHRKSLADDSLSSAASTPIGAVLDPRGRILLLETHRALAIRTRASALAAFVPVIGTVAGSHRALKDRTAALRARILGADSAVLVFHRGVPPKCLEGVSGNRRRAEIRQARIIIWCSARFVGQGTKAGRWARSMHGSASPVRCSRCIIAASANGYDQHGVSAA
jgi:hypothetical protein